ncbi:MAG: hypothetical protein JO089_06210, partial [Alphaproteobacteria bacterium]|nr:hypothetical protein [Alphaproteobacteria bacterium]
QNRRIREIAFQRAALGNGTLLAPLRSEFWDDRMPGSEKDLWRVMESVCRCIGVAAPPQRAEDYATFCSQWARLDAQKLTAALGEKAVTPLAPEKLIFHERFNPLYDADLPESMRLSMISPERLPSQNLNRAA